MGGDGDELAGAVTPAFEGIEGLSGVERAVDGGLISAIANLRPCDLQNEGRFVALSRPGGKQHPNAKRSVIMLRSVEPRS